MSEKVMLWSDVPESLHELLDDTPKRKLVLLFAKSKEQVADKRIRKALTRMFKANDELYLAADEYLCTHDGCTEHMSTQVAVECEVLSREVSEYIHDTIGLNATYVDKE